MIMGSMTVFGFWLALLIFALVNKVIAQQKVDKVANKVQFFYKFFPTGEG